MHRQMCTSDVTALQFSSHKQILSTPSGRSRDENVSSCCCRLPVAQVTMKTDHVAAKSGVISLAGLWLTLAFVLNLAWEIAHVRLYAIWAEADQLSIAWAVLHCTLGDVAIALAMFALAGVLLRRRDWPATRPWAGGAIVVIGATAFTTWSEWYNVYNAGNWGYAANMPTIFGIGLSPLLQWLILPPVMVVVYRLLEPMLFVQRRSPSPIPAHESTRNRT